MVNIIINPISRKYDVIRALRECKLWGYGADVIEDEFGDVGISPFFNLDMSKLNCIFTPHIGGMTIQGQTKAYKWAVRKL